MDLSTFTSLALAKCPTAAEVSVMKAHLHSVISAAVIAGGVPTRYWSTVDVPGLLALDAAAAATAGGTAEGDAPNESTFAPTGGTVDTTKRAVREAAPGEAATNNGGGGSSSIASETTTTR